MRTICRRLAIIFQITGFLSCFANFAIAESNDEPDFVDRFYPIIYDLDDPSVFFLVGDIDVRTALNFKRAVLEVGSPEVLVLSSNGGIVHVGLDLALEVSRLGLTTYIPEGMGCYSSCSFVFLAGIQRVSDGELGVHQISGGDGDLEKGQLAISDIIDVLNKFETPPELYAMMLRTKASEMYILSNSELEGLGLLEGRKSIANRTTQETLGPKPDEIESAALKFVENANALWTGAGTPNLELVSSLYDITVDYYGNFWTNNQVFEDKFAFVKRWPVRQYILDLEKSRAVCPTENTCQVTGHIIWEVASPERNKTTSGESRFEYLLKQDNGKFSIIKENALVIKRD